MLQESALPVAVSVSVEELDGISSSVLKAETWLKTHVLAHYPANGITTIVVKTDFLCLKPQVDEFGLVLLSLKNIHYSITRWGLQRELKVSPGFSSHCSVSERDDFAEKVIKPLSEFLHIVNSTYSVVSSSLTNHKASSFVSYTVKKLGFLPENGVNLLIQIQQKYMRKLSEPDSKTINPYPARPTPLPEISPIHSSIGFSVPATVATPQSPISHSAFSPSPTFSFPSTSPPPLSFPATPPAPSAPMTYSPKLAPVGFPGAPGPYGSLPPCRPIENTMAPAPHSGGGMTESLWCVAKPNVPAETLQEAMDYACGEGGADCEEIQPQGSCFHPDTLVAHASYAFNSYWQKNKRSGGTCGFGGTAMLINADPSNNSLQLY